MKDKDKNKNKIVLYRPDEEKGKIILYQPDNSLKLEIRLENEIVWFHRQLIETLRQ
jgi:hypothetical protein